MLRRVVNRCYSHGINPKRHGIIKVLGLCQAMIKESDAHLQNYTAVWLVSQELLEHVDQRVMDLFRVQVEQLNNVELLQALNQLDG